MARTYTRTAWQDRFWRFVTRGADDECWEWSGSRNARGYGRLNRDGKVLKAHRASYLIHHGEIPEGASVCHRCDNPPCVNPAHLFVGSQRDNLLDASAKRRTAPQRGAFAHRRKLSDDQVRAVRERAAEGIPYAAIAAEFGIHNSFVSTLATGKSRADAGGPLTHRYPWRQR